MKRGFLQSKANSVFILNVSNNADFSLTTFGEAGLGTMFIGGRADLRLDVSAAGVIDIRGHADFTRGATIASALNPNLCLREISPEMAFRLAAAHVDRGKLIVESVPYQLGPDAIFTDLPMRQYRGIRQLFESGGV